MTWFNRPIAVALMATFAATAFAPAASAAPKRAAAAAPVAIVGQVSRVVDGDTLWVKAEGDGEPPVVVRLEGIDAPESCQAGGADATAALTALALGRNVSVRVAARATTTAAASARSTTARRIWATAWCATAKRGRHATSTTAAPTWPKNAWPWP